MSPGFFPGWEGIAYARYYGGDLDAARDALMKEKEIASQPNDKLGADGRETRLCVPLRTLVGHDVTGLRSQASSENRNGTGGARCQQW